MSMCAVWLVDAPTWMMGAWCEEWSATLILDRPITMAEPERAHNVDTRAGVKGRQACEPSLIIAVIILRAFDAPLGQKDSFKKGKRTASAYNAQTRCILLWSA